MPIAAYVTFQKTSLIIQYSLWLFAGMLTSLISYRAGRFAGRLTGCLALATAAFFHRFLQISRR